MFKSEIKKNNVSGNIALMRHIVRKTLMNFICAEQYSCFQTLFLVFVILWWFFYLSSSFGGFGRVAFRERFILPWLSISMTFTVISSPTLTMSST